MHNFAKSQKILKGLLAIAVAVAALGAFAEGNVFWWKGADWGLFDDPANWDVGAVGEGNADNLIPGTEDAVAHAADAKINLNGKTFTVKRRATDLTTSAETGAKGMNECLHLTNGTLVVTEHHTAKLNLEVWDGATYRFEGTEYMDAFANAVKSRHVVHSGGRIEINDKTTKIIFNNVYMIVEENGTLLVDPTKIEVWPTTTGTMAVTNNGTLLAPRGFYIVNPTWGNGDADVSVYFPRIYQEGGVLKLGGNVGRDNVANAKQLGLTLSGGTVEVTNSVAFVNMSANPPSVSANASVTFDVKVDSQFDVAGLLFEEGSSITKTGEGDLKMADAMPPSLFVREGRVVFTDAATLSGLSFETNTQVRVDVESVRIDDCESFTNATFSVGESLQQVGSTVLLSTDADILAHAKKGLDAQLAAAGVHAEGRIESGALVVRSAYPYTFNAAVSSDLADRTAWRLGEVPSADTPVRISGAGTVNFTAESRKFASITVEEGATLSVSGGTAESPVDMPVVELDYVARLLLAEGSVVQITNTFTCVGNADTLPVFEVATNALAIVQTPGGRFRYSPVTAWSSYGGAEYGFTLKNVALRWYGTIKTKVDDLVNRREFSTLRLGSAEVGETSYIAVDCRGGKYIATGEALDSSKGRNALTLVAPEVSGKSTGTVIPVGTLYFRDLTIETRKSSGSNPESHPSGFYIGKWSEYNGAGSVQPGNPDSVKYDVLFEGDTVMQLCCTYRITGGANVILRGPGAQWRYDRTAWNDENGNRTLILRDQATLTVEDGAYLDVCSSEASSRGLNARGTTDGQNVLTVRDSRMSLLNWIGTGKGVAEVDNSLLEIGYLRSSSTLATITGVFDGMKSVAISNTFTIAAADVDRGNSSKTSTTSVENWNRRVHIGPPLTGPGSLVVSNELAGAHAVYSMTVTVTNGANTATGKAFAAETESGAPTALVFADGANWAGEVVSDGNVTLTNLVSEGSAAEVSFAALRAESAFPLRVWKTGGVIVSNDKVNLASAIAGSGSFAFVEMDEPLVVGDSFEVGLYPEGAALPATTRTLSFATEPSETEDYVRLIATYTKRGLIIKIF